MKEEIKKQIEQEAKKYAGYVEGNPSHEEMVRRLAYENGANFILSKWQETERWRKIEEERPPKSGNYLARTNYGIRILYFDNSKFFNPDLPGGWNIGAGTIVIEWKPIVR